MTALVDIIRVCKLQPRRRLYLVDACHCCIPEIIFTISLVWDWLLRPTLSDYISKSIYIMSKKISPQSEPRNRKKELRLAQQFSVNRNFWSGRILRITLQY